MVVSYGKDRILFFDGVCGLCNRVVNVFMRLSGGQTLLFAPLQGSTAKAMLPENFTEQLDTLVYFRDGEIWTKVNAVGRILEDMGGVWKLAKILRVFPEFLGNFAYDIVASNRYNLFGKRGTCRIPTLEEKARFLP